MTGDEILGMMRNCTFILDNILFEVRVQTYPLNGPWIKSTYQPKERNTSKLTKYQLNKLRKCQETTQE